MTWLSSNCNLLYLCTTCLASKNSDFTVNMLSANRAARFYSRALRAHEGMATRGQADRNFVFVTNLADVVVV